MTRIDQLFLVGALAALQYKIQYLKWTLFATRKLAVLIASQSCTATQLLTRIPSHASTESTQRALLCKKTIFSVPACSQRFKGAIFL